MTGMTDMHLPSHRTAATAFSWHVHTALERWGGHADRKAAVLLVHQGGAFVLGVTVSEPPWPPLTVVTLGLLLVAMSLTAAVLFPRLGPATRLARESGSHLIYFGHLRAWKTSQLTRRLAALPVDEELAMLSAQLVALSRLTWRKHRLVQASTVCTLLAMGSGMAALVGMRVR